MKSRRLPHRISTPTDHWLPAACIYPASRELLMSGLVLKSSALERYDNTNRTFSLRPLVKFKAAGDSESVKVLEVIHWDEVTHVLQLLGIAGLHGLVTYWTRTRYKLSDVKYELTSQEHSRDHSTPSTGYAQE
ncbi:unnamed protein product [Rhizoctonia solani]|uniref:Uncharacterized protein n=1 Tax=Rhizoctonia solani TaxID=456999 RepID=A0A8H3E2W6_9AGAM|nr:unnamed protein product [Rhizoctonia solani]